VDEFGLIRRYFTRAARSADVIVGVGDDGAVLAPTPGMQQVQVIDTLVEGVHFPARMRAADVGFRAVAVNLSDIAAMGATPRWMTLALTLSDKDESWVDDFAAGLFEAASKHNVELVGGDTTSGDAVVATVHITGEVEQGKALLRSGARVGDTVYITGTPGDAAASLARFGVSLPDSCLVQRFLRPTPRMEHGRALAGLASACIDVSDGLVGDLAKLCDASGVGAELDLERLPLSADLLEAFEIDRAIDFALTGGDDYELCFTAQADTVAHLEGITAIGTITDGSKVVCRRAGAIVTVDDSGYRHFA
jgi:thiamine-monophosphate kinase